MEYISPTGSCKEKDWISESSRHSSVGDSLSSSLSFKYKDTVMPGEKEEDFRQTFTSYRFRALDLRTNLSHSSQSTPLYPDRPKLMESKSVPSVHSSAQNDKESKIDSRNGEFTAVKATNEAVEKLSRDKCWWRTDRALTLYGNLDNDVSESLLPSKKQLIGSEYELGEDDVDEYESWVTFRQTHKCLTSIPNSHFDCAIFNFQKSIGSILAPLDSEVGSLTRSIHRHISRAEEEFEKIIDIAYPTCTDVHPYLTRSPTKDVSNTTRPS